MVYQRSIRLNYRRMTYEPVDHERFPALRLGISAGVAGGAAPAVFNAANECAVARFPRGQDPVSGYSARDLSGARRVERTSVGNARSAAGRRCRRAASCAGDVQVLSWLAPIIVFGLVVFVHELGHFIAAKLTGVYAPRFSIGFGPSLLKRRIGETEYVLAALPLGGYVRMASREDEATAFLEGGSENSATTPRIRRTGSIRTR